MQDQLLDSFFGIDRGSSANSELKAEISELIAALEAQNPTEAPNQVPPCIWGMAMTSALIGSQREVGACHRWVLCLTDACSKGWVCGNTIYSSCAARTYMYMYIYIYICVCVPTAPAPSSHLCACYRAPQLLSAGCVSAAWGSLAQPSASDLPISAACIWMLAGPGTLPCSCEQHCTGGISLPTRPASNLSCFMMLMRVGKVE